MLKHLLLNRMYESHVRRLRKTSQQPVGLPADLPALKSIRHRAILIRHGNARRSLRARDYVVPYRVVIAMTRGDLASRTNRSKRSREPRVRDAFLRDAIGVETFFSRLGFRGGKNGHASWSPCETNLIYLITLVGYKYFSAKVNWRRGVSTYLKRRLIAGRSLRSKGPIISGLNRGSDLGTRAAYASCSNGQAMSRSRGGGRDRSVELRRTYTEFSLSLGSPRGRLCHQLLSSFPSSPEPPPPRLTLGPSLPRPNA